MSDLTMAIEYPAQSERAARPRIWLPVAAIALYWAYVIVSSMLEMPMFPRFMSQMGAFGLVALIFLVWWLSNRRVTWADKLIVLAAVVASPILAKLVSDKTLGPFPIMNGLPLVFTGWALWMLLAQRARHGGWRGGLVVAVFLSTGVFPFLRMGGL